MKLYSATAELSVIHRTYEFTFMQHHYFSFCYHNIFLQRERSQHVAPPALNTKGPEVSHPHISPVLRSSPECVITRSYPLFELPDLGGGEAVGLGDQRDHVHLVLQGFHELDVHRTQPVGRGPT